MHEALTAEATGYEIDLTPDLQSHLRRDHTDETLWQLYLNMYGVGITVCLNFYTDQIGNYQFGCAEQNGTDQELTADEYAVLEEIYEWLKDNKRFDNG